MGTRGGAASAAERQSERVRLKVLYDFEYDTRGKRVRIIKDEKLLLIKKTNDDWWQVVRPADVNNFYVPEQSTFYVPTGYVVEIQEEPLPETTRFYVDKDKMFKSNDVTSQGTSSQQHSMQDKSHKVHETAVKEEPRKAHESFRNVIRKLSGNLGAINDSNKVKPAKPSKIIKNLRKNSVDNSNEDIKTSKSNLGIVSTKHKDTWESSTFGMCFGRDMKHVDAQILNPFQEELENALSNRVTQKKNILDTKLEVSKQVDQVCDDKDLSSKFENIQDKWEKASAQVLKKSDNFQFVPLSKIKEDAQKRRSASPNFPKIEIPTNACTGAKRLSDTDKLYSVIDKNPKKSVQSSDQISDNKTNQILDRKVDQTTDNKIEPKTDRKINQKIENKSDKKIDYKPDQKVEKKIDHKIDKKLVQKLEALEKHTNSTFSVSSNKNNMQETPNKDIDRLLINDKRKMWAIETLMSELMQSATNSKTIATSENNEIDISGPNQLAQELHDMTVSRRFENAEIQVNLLDNNDNNTKENEDENANANAKCKMESWKRKVFDFSHSNIKPPKSPTARSPKLLDEYNEANILNDNDRPKQLQDVTVKVLNYNESPSYSNISMHIKRENVPCTLKMPTKDFREELQLTPSLEKLASEIRFLPANTNSVEFDNDKHSLDIDCPTTTLSQDSLRLYKRCSKSDGALNKREPRRRDSVNSQHNSVASASHTEIFKNQQQHQHHHHYHHHHHHHIERKYAQHETQRCSSKQQQQHEGSTTANQEYYYRAERVSQTARYKLNRKSKSLGDLDCSEMEEKNEDTAASSSAYEIESRRRYKPIPKLRSKESLRRIKPSTLLVTPTASAERLTGGKPVPAKRRVAPQQTQPQPQPMCDSSYDDLSEIDIERSTAVGFKTLLRTSDSGSEEYLQYKTFPATGRTTQQSYEQSKLGGAHSRSDGNVNSLSRSLSDEAILSSTSCSSASPSRILDDSVENLVNLPAGWTQTYDNNAKRVCFINERGDKWFSSSDSEGKIYFFEENSNESSWALPTIATENRARTLSNDDWPQLFDGNMCILKEGVINKTKITTENGKKLRKAWSTSYAVLTELFLLFFKDEKSFAAMKMNQSAAAKPDISVDLNGAFIESAEKLSNRKNVYLINTLLGLQVLIQWDNPVMITEWYREIHNAIQRLPFSQEYGRSSSSRE